MPDRAKGITQPGAATGRPNLVLVCVDQWRGDCLGIDRRQLVETPYLDELALNGVGFSRACSATPSCVPARAALLTGLGQANHGRVGYSDGVPWNYPVTIAGDVTRHGYQTEAIGKMHVYPERSQMGFQHVRLHDGFLHFARNYHPRIDAVDDYQPWLRRELGRDADYFDHGINCNGVTTRPWDKPEHTHPTNWIVTEAIDFVGGRDPRKPFFLYLGFHRPHPPYDPPRWAFEQYTSQKMPEPPIGDWIDILEPYRHNHLHDSQVARFPRKVIDRARAGYFGHMTHIDHHLNRLFEHLRQFDQMENTWVCFVSDHGEMLGDHDLYRKSVTFEGSARVPFILKGPSGALKNPGTAHDALAELRDVMPTLLDCAGLSLPDGLDGQSLLPVARGEVSSVRPWIHCEHPTLGQAMHWLTDGHEKYGWWSGTGREHLFDLASDPQELHDIAPDSARSSRPEHWRNNLGQALAGREDGLSDGRQLLTGRPVSSILPSVIERFRPAT